MAGLSATVGTASFTFPDVTWTGDLAVGATAILTYTVTVKNPDSTDQSLVTSIASAAAGGACTTAVPCVNTVTVLTPGLAVSTTANVATAMPGDPRIYTISIANTGQTAYVGTTLTTSLAGIIDDAGDVGAATASLGVVSDTLLNTGQADYAAATFIDSPVGLLDDAVYSADAATDMGTLQFTDNALAWTGPLGVGAATTITFSVTTNFPASGDQLMLNTVISPSDGSNCSDGISAACNTSVTVLEPALLISKTVDTTVIVAGGTVNYTTIATNTGQAGYPSLVLTDSLAGVLDDGVFNEDATASSRGGSAIPRRPDRDRRALGRWHRDHHRRRGDQHHRRWRRQSDQHRGVECPSATTTARDPWTRCVRPPPRWPRTPSRSAVSPALSPLRGLPHAIVTAVTMTVTTNSPGGYFVTVAATGDLTTLTPGNTGSSIPLDLLFVRECGTFLFLPLTTLPQLVHAQNTASPPGGDAVSNDYQMVNPFITADTYSTTLEYIVTAQ